MSRLHFETTLGSCVDALTVMEKYLDDNHEIIPYSVHRELVEAFNEMNGKVQELVKEYEDRIEELEDELSELKEGVA